MAFHSNGYQIRLNSDSAVYMRQFSSGFHIDERFCLPVFQKSWSETTVNVALKNLVGTTKNGDGGDLVMGCMTASRLGNLTLIDDIMDDCFYLKLSVQDLGIEDIFAFCSQHSLLLSR
ncbi:hypothetical protein AVEN_162955-1 [Araneus ventricosus]|uniref:Uncharacterized protein n=1 Tax=Araneus ventricosus TaxID=182803 RepID=A0A4Y2C2D2_ARAVE|nr:hypothetical protein AVEN_162955-1 [Araneus ventricosus]